MTPDILNTLRDIHLPPPISLWPPAPGWFLLGLLLIIIGFISLLGLYVFLQKKLFKKNILKQIQQVQHQFEQHKNSNIALAELSTLLKQVALVKYPRTEIAHLYGTSWVTFLKNTSKKSEKIEILDIFSEAPYQSHIQIEISDVFKTVRLWVKNNV